MWRVYDSTLRPAGKCFLVERLWPRGVSRERLENVTWLKEVAPSAELRKWFAHLPERWPEFQDRYRAELERNPAALMPLLDAARGGGCVLLYSTRDPVINSAVVLREFLEERHRAA
jgi:uncharacterized protein YeaO (DUF488 family)